jgi:hypothetical protein
VVVSSRKRLLLNESPKIELNQIFIENFLRQLNEARLIVGLQE